MNKYLEKVAYRKIRMAHRVVSTQGDDLVGTVADISGHVETVRSFNRQYNSKQHKQKGRK
jgi:hypothetical protein